MLHSRDPVAVTLLKRLVIETKRSQTRVQAIWTLADLGELDEPSALAGLKDPDPKVRESVIGATWPAARKSPLIVNALLGLANDDGARVRFQLALALGGIDDSKAGETLALLARRDGNDSWMRAAILSSAVPHVATLLANLVGGGNDQGAPPTAIVEPLLAMAGSLPDNILTTEVARSIGEPAGKDGHYAPWQFAALAGLLEARDRSGKPIGLALDNTFARLWSTARQLIKDNSAAETDRLPAIQLLGHSAKRNNDDRDLLISLIRPQVAVGLQQAAVAALGRTTDAKLPDLLVRDWKRHSPQVRGAILDVLLSRTGWTASLLSSLEDGCVPPAEIDPARRQQLLARRGNSIRARAEAVFAHEAKPRQAVVDSFRPALAVKGDRTAGAAVFKKLCTSCHRLGNEGVEVGADLASLNDKSAESLMIAILDPNRAFETKYSSFTVATADGRVVTGMIVNESATAVILRLQDGKEATLLRSEIQEMTASGQSFMPEGLEKDLKTQDIADLIAYLAASGPPRKPE